MRASKILFSRGYRKPNHLFPSTGSEEGPFYDFRLSSGLFCTFTVWPSLLTFSGHYSVGDKKLI